MAVHRVFLSLCAVFPIAYYDDDYYIYHLYEDRLYTRKFSARSFDGKPRGEPASQPADTFQRADTD